MKSRQGCIRENTTYPPFGAFLGAILVPYPKVFNCWFNPFVKSLFCPINASPNEFLVRTPLDPPPPHLKPTFWRF